MNYIKSVFAILLAGTLLFGCGEKTAIIPMYLAVLAR